MDYPKFIVSNQKEESISIKRVKSIPNCRVRVSAYIACLLEHKTTEKRDYN